MPSSSSGEWRSHRVAVGVSDLSGGKDVILIPGNIGTGLPYKSPKYPFCSARTIRLAQRLYTSS